ncbi:MAG: hypothetical protein ACTSP4_09995 [Candidatus Hodarchaeales archaeon]
MFKRFIDKKNNKKQNIKNLEKKIQELEEENIRELKRIKKLMETNRKSEALNVARRYKLRLQTIKNIKKIISTLKDNYAMAHSTMEMASTDLSNRQIKLDNNLDSEQEFKISLEYDNDINIKPDDDLEELEEIISLAMDDQSIEHDPAIISGAVAPSPSPVDAEMETETKSAVSPAKMRSGPVPEPAPRMASEIEPIKLDNNLDSEQEFKISLDYDNDINIKPDDDLEELEEIISLAMDDQSIVRTPPLDEMDKELDSLLKILAEDETEETPAIEPDPAIISGAVAPSPSPVDAEMETETESAVSPAKMRSGPVPEPAPRMVPEVEPVTAEDSEPTGELALEAEPAPPPAPGMVPEIEPVTAEDSEPTGELAFETEPAPPPLPASRKAMKPTKMKKASLPATKRSQSKVESKVEEIADEAPVEMVKDVSKLKKIFTGIQYYDRITPLENFPLIVELSHEAIMKIKDKRNLITGTRRTQKRAELGFKEDVVEVIPLCPGCLVSPTSRIADLKLKKQELKFTVTPLIKGEINARIEFRTLGRKTLHSIDIPMKSRSKTYSRVIAIIGTAIGVAPSVVKYIADIDINSILQNRLIQDFPSLTFLSGNGLLYLEIGVIVASIGLSLVLAYRLRPRQSNKYSNIKPSRT